MFRQSLKIPWSVVDSRHAETRLVGDLKLRPAFTETARRNALTTTSVPEIMHPQAGIK
jgi:hypothetical protein